MSDRIPVIALLRVSTGAQAGEERYGLPVQKQICIETAQREGLRIIRFVTMKAVSGTETILTPEMSGILDALRSGEARGVVTREFSRLMRPERMGDWAILEVFQESNSILYLPEGPLDPNDPEGILMANIKGGFSAFERHKIFQRMQSAGLSYRQDGGRWGVISRGVTYQRRGKAHVWAYDGIESKVVLAAYQALFDGATIGELAVMLKTTRTGVRSILSNPIYKGWRVYSHKMTKKQRGAKQRRVKLDDDKVIALKVIEPGLVSDAEWNRAQAIFAEINEAHRRDGVAARARRAAAGLAPRALYSGFVFCDYCGRLMTPQNGSKNRISYVCIGRSRYKTNCPNRYVAAPKLEANIDHVFSSVVSDPAFRRRLAMHLEQAREDKSRAVQLETLRKQLAALDAKRLRILENYDEGNYSKAQRDAKLKTLDAQRATLSTAIERASSEMMPALDESLLQAAFEAFAGWSMLGIEDRRRVLAVTAPRLRIRDGKMVSFFRSLDGHDMPVPVGAQISTEHRSSRKESIENDRMLSH